MDDSEFQDRICQARVFCQRTSEVHIPSDDHMEMVVDIIAEGKRFCGTCLHFCCSVRYCAYRVEDCHLLKDACCEWEPELWIR
jgi:hypothetical protein